MGVLSPVVALHPSGHARSSQFGCRQWVEARAGGRDEQKAVQLVHEHTDETRLAVEQEQARIARSCMTFPAPDRDRAEPGSHLRLDRLPA
jgi:hypothetical protein